MLYFTTTQGDIERAERYRKEWIEKYRIEMLTSIRSGRPEVLVKIREPKFLRVKEGEIVVDLLREISSDDKEDGIQELEDFFTQANQKQLEDFRRALFSESFRDYEKNTLFIIAEVLGAFRLGTTSEKVKESVRILVEERN